MAPKRQRTKFDVIAEIAKIDAEMEYRNDPDAFMGERGGYAETPDVELMKQKAQLRHELKMFDVTPVDGKEGDAVKKLWKRTAEEKQKKADRKKKEAKLAIEKAKEELAKDPKAIKQIVADMSPAQKKALLKELQNSTN